MSDIDKFHPGNRIRHVDGRGGTVTDLVEPWSYRVKFDDGSTGDFGELDLNTHPEIYGREQIGRAINKLDIVRDYPVHPRVRKAVVRWAKLGGNDAYAASGLVRLSSPDIINAQIEILGAALSNHSEDWAETNTLAINLAKAINETKG
ncbi:hypothetical protein [Leifsonia sp. Leaf264]|uniref:hypothetical protein n=1 Tax=Leifsonia sp. Leaf264 TaxID=1736314 RepID=UPI0006FF897D|nr:hypothetical protein [Leifsonia sp. Leaf264]KQO98377.1 hypothetical protein ASF30_09970 [Leifsonia sp. Leaf264]